MFPAAAAPKTAAGNASSDVAGLASDSSMFARSWSVTSWSLVHAIEQRYFRRSDLRADACGNAETGAGGRQPQN